MINVTEVLQEGVWRVGGQGWPRLWL